MAMDMFLEIATLKGETKDKVFKDKGGIDVLAWSFGASNSGSAHVGGGSGSGKANVQDISVTKWVDSTSPLLMLATCAGTHYDTAKLTVRKAGGDAPLEYMIISMEEVLISSVSTGGSGGEDRLTENISLNFARFKYEYRPQTPKGAAEPTIPMTWDIAANAKEA